MSHLRAKAELRKHLRGILKNQPEAERAAASVQAVALLAKQSIWKDAKSVLLYAAIPGEVNLTPLIDAALTAGKVVLLPRFVAAKGTYEAVRVSHFERDCAPGKFGIAEPKAHCEAFPLKTLDLALAPGLGFDLAGRRLGRGQGFYDRMLAQIAGAKCGVAFDSQIMGEIPAEAHDIHMNFILTPTRWLKISE
jgi:5-formyltetrahydrofolate cyclo-ligase